MIEFYVDAAMDFWKLSALKVHKHIEPPVSKPSIGWWTAFKEKQVSESMSYSQSLNR
jgi:hypothetical protein